MPLLPRPRASALASRLLEVGRRARSTHFSAAKELHRASSTDSLPTVRSDPHTRFAAPPSSISSSPPSPRSPTPPCAIAPHLARHEVHARRHGVHLPVRQDVSRAVQLRVRPQAQPRRSRPLRPRDAVRHRQDRLAPVAHRRLPICASSLALLCLPATRADARSSSCSTSARWADPSASSSTARAPCPRSRRLSPSSSASCSTGALPLSPHALLTRSSS